MRPRRASAQRRITYLGGIQFSGVERHHRVGGADAKPTQHRKRYDPRGAARGHGQHQQQRDARQHEEEHGGDATTRVAQHYHRHHVRRYIHDTCGHNVQVATDREIGGIQS